MYRNIENTTCQEKCNVKNNAKTGLQYHYKGPYKILERHDKHFVIQIGDKTDKVSITRLKSAHLLDEGTDSDHDDEPVFGKKRSKNWDVIIPENNQPTSQNQPPVTNNNLPPATNINQNRPTLLKSNIPRPPRFPTNNSNIRHRTAPRLNKPSLISTSQRQFLPTEDAGTSSQDEASSVLTNQTSKPRLSNTATGYSYMPLQSRGKPQEKMQVQAPQSNEQTNDTAETSSRPDHHQNPELRRSARTNKGLPPKRLGFFPRWT